MKTVTPESQYSDLICQIADIVRSQVWGTKTESKACLEFETCAEKFLKNRTIDEVNLNLVEINQKLTRIKAEYRRETFELRKKISGLTGFYLKKLHAKLLLYKEKELNFLEDMKQMKNFASVNKNFRRDVMCFLSGEDFANNEQSDSDYENASGFLRERILARSISDRRRVQENCKKFSR